MHKCQVKPGPEQEFYNIKAAAAFFSIGTTTIYKAVQQRQIKHARIGKSIRISHVNLTQWIEDQTKPTLAEVNAKHHSHKNRKPNRAMHRHQNLVRT